MNASSPADIPRPEHPRPQFRRSAWINLNGAWTCRSEPVRPGQLQPDKHRDMAARGGFESPITVPFCPESPLSGVGDRDFIGVIWYHRVIEVPAEWAGRRVLLHFGAVFYRAEIYVDGAYAGQHVGGSVSFAVDVTRFVEPGGSHHLMVAVTNDLWSGAQPSGKQSWKYRSYGCHYTRTTGIWQTVWMEAVDPCGLADVHIVADIEAGRLLVTPSFHGIAAGQRFEVSASLDGREVGSAGRAARDGIPLSLEIADPELWEPESPVLYDLELRVTRADGAEADRVSSYAGLRETHIEGNRVFLNGTPRYLKLVLDQGFYPDGIWTAPSDAGSAARHRALPGGRLQWGPTAPEGLRGALPLLGRPSRLSALGGVAELGARPPGRGGTAPQLPGRVAGDRASRPQPPQHRRLDPVQRDAGTSATRGRTNGSTRTPTRSARAWIRPGRSTTRRVTSTTSPTCTPYTATSRTPRS